MIYRVFVEKKEGMRHEARALLQDAVSLLNIKTKYNWLLLISFILFLFLLTASICIKTYDSYKCIGIVDNNQIIMKINSNNVKKVLDSKFLIIDNKKIKFSIQSVGELQYDEYSNENYQIVIISTSDNYLDNLALELTFYNNKQRIITKIINLLK